jgi:hypothetical protein
MANLIRSAKSGSNWGINELIAFNIEVVDVDAATFFGNATLPQPMVSSVILDYLNEPAVALSKSDMDFFAYLEDAMAIPPGEESLVDDFAAFVLKMMRYDEGRRVIHLRKEMGFEMCGERVDAKTDVCVMERSGPGAKYLLLVQEDKVRSANSPYRRSPDWKITPSVIYLGTTLNLSLLRRQWLLCTRTTKLAKLLDYRSFSRKHLPALQWLELRPLSINCL